MDPSYKICVEDEWVTNLGICASLIGLNETLKDEQKYLTNQFLKNFIQLKMICIF